MLLIKVKNQAKSQKANKVYLRKYNSNLKRLSTRSMLKAKNYYNKSL